MHRKELDVPSRSHQPLKPLSVHSVGPKIVNPPSPACMCDRTGGGKQLGKQGLLPVLVSAVAVLINLPLGNSCEKTEAGRFPSIAKYLNYLSTPSSPSWACSGGALRSSPLLFLQVCPCSSPPSSPLAAWICAACEQSRPCFSSGESWCAGGRDGETWQLRTPGLQHAQPWGLCHLRHQCCGLEEKCVPTAGRDPWRHSPML